MAQGDLTVFEEFPDQLGKEIHNFQSDTLKLGIINNTSPPAAGDETPVWADYSANEVSSAGGYVAGGMTLSGVTFTEAGGTATLDDTGNVSLAQNPAGFTDGYWGIIYNDSATLKNAIAFVDLGGPASEQAGPININWGAAGILTVAVV